MDHAHLQLVVCGSTSCHYKGCSALRTFEVVLFTNRQLDRLHGQTLTWPVERHPVSTRHGRWCMNKKSTRYYQIFRQHIQEWTPTTIPLHTKPGGAFPKAWKWEIIRNCSLFPQGSGPNFFRIWPRTLEQSVAPKSSWAQNWNITTFRSRHEIIYEMHKVHNRAQLRSHA